MRKLAVAGAARDIDSVFERAYTRGQPGFQISPEVPAADCLAILQDHMRTRLGLRTFAFNVTFGTVRPPDDIPGIRQSFLKVGVGEGGEDHDSGPHIDEPESRRELGIVMHDNLRGVGRVVLQLARPDITELEHDEHGFAVIRRADTASPKYEGEIVPDMKTVFYERFTTSGLIAATMGATIHDFQSTGPQRDWVRYGWEPLAA